MTDPNQKMVLDTENLNVSVASSSEQALAQNQIFQDDNELLQTTQFMNTLQMAASLSNMFKHILAPPPANNEDEYTELPKMPEIDEEALLEGVKIIKGDEILPELLTQVDKISANLRSDHAAFKTSDAQTMAQIAAREGVRQRPNYFSPLTEESPPSPNALFTIGSNFLREFVSEGPLDLWMSHIERAINKKMPEPLKRARVLEFLNTLKGGIQHAISEDVNDPAKDPQNKYVNPGDIERARDLREWLDKNEGHLDYDDIHEKFMKLHGLIMEQQIQAMKESSSYMLNLLKDLDPEIMEGVEDSEDVTKKLNKISEEKKRKKFEEYVLNEYENLNIFESVHIRAFSEYIYRNQYGNIYYNTVCESFEPIYQDSLFHKTVYSIWAMSHLDTINIRPKEAKSRMPNESGDGLPAGNFGYQMQTSTAYQEWIKNDLVRASGDIAMDAFQFCSDFGRKLDIDFFLKRFINFFDDTEEKRNEIIKNPHPYDNFLIKFSFFLLEKIFNKPHHQGENVYEALKREGENEENILLKAREVLKEFQVFSARMCELRSVSAKDPKLCPVFGVGFNGDIFDSPSHHMRNKNEIWLAFSSFGRNNGGRLFTWFVKKIMSNHIYVKLALPDGFYNKYQKLIGINIKNKIKVYSDYIRIASNFRNRNYYIDEVKKLEGFLLEIEEDKSFENLSNEFKIWISEKSNWYHIPDDISIEIPEEMPVIEHNLQYLARNLLFDALTLNNFFRLHLDLLALSFLHWKERLLDYFENNFEIKNAIKMANKLSDIYEKYQDEIISELNKIVSDINPIFLTVWLGKINSKFEEFKRNKKSPLDSKILSLNKQIKILEKNMAALQRAKKPSEDSRIKLEENIKDVGEKLKQALEEKTYWENVSLNGLSVENHREFREVFFKSENSGVSQCIEPLFARVLGHDHFFAILISPYTPDIFIKDPQNSEANFILGNTKPLAAIPPCNNRCQYHALGHVYTADALSKQSADKLHHMRVVHNLGDLPDRFMSLKNMNANAAEAVFPLKAPSSSPS